jgi:DNA-binding MarR family transcriptional regulator
MASSHRPQDDLAGIEVALDHLLRLNASRKVHARRAAAVGVVISQPGLLLLRRLDEHGELSMGELARLTAMDPAAAGRQVRQLEQDGLVIRTRGSDDGRVVTVDLTPRGTEVRRRLGAAGDRHMADVLSTWSTEDRAQLSTLLRRFVDGLRETPFRQDAEDLAS